MVYKESVVMNAVFLKLQVSWDIGQKSLILFILDSSWIV
jgi:hypothetical protein